MPAVLSCTRERAMAAWRSTEHLQDHFVRHRRRLRVASVAAYVTSAEETIRVGVYFEYRDPETDEPRVGYYDEVGHRFVGLTDDETAIVTHFRCNEGYVERLPGSTYT